MEVAPFFVDFHHFLSIFTIFYWFSRFTHFCRDLHFVAIYALFLQIFLAKIAISATSHVFCMYALGVQRKDSPNTNGEENYKFKLREKRNTYWEEKYKYKSRGRPKIRGEENTFFLFTVREAFLAKGPPTIRLPWYWSCNN